MRSAHPNFGDGLASRVPGNPRRTEAIFSAGALARCLLLQPVVRTLVPASTLLVALAACGPVADDLRTEDDALVVCAHGVTTKGVDVSHWEGTIDWAAVKAAGIEFAFMK